MAIKPTHDEIGTENQGALKKRRLEPEPPQEALKRKGSAF